LSAAARRQRACEGDRSRTPLALLESGECASITELAAAEKIDRSYLCRVLRLTLLAPELVAAISDGRQPEEVTLPVLLTRSRWNWKQPLGP
jgi:hypothetical protein